MLDHAHGGNDTLITFGFGSVYGDAGRNIADHALGGNDTLKADISSAIGVNTLNMFGDAGGDLLDHAVAGNDNLNAQLAVTDNATVNVNLYGDVGGSIYDHAVSGNDIVSASINFSSSDFFSTPLTVNLNMFGDAEEISQIMGWAAMTP